MTTNRVIGAAAIAMVLMASAARAQEQGQVGIAMGYPASVAVIWHVTDAIAVRPDVTFSGGHNESATVKSDSTNVGVGISGLIYIGTWESLRTYVSPRYSYGRSSSTIETTFPVDPTLLTIIGLTIPPASTTSTTSTMGLAGSFGAQYSLHKHFSAFGEVGFGYSKLTSTRSTSRTTLFPDPSLDTDPKASSWGTRSAVGVIFYF
jgi:hypothetical protein